MKIDKIDISHPDKIMFPDDNYLKKDLVDYYAHISQYILPYIKERPLSLKRYPKGIAESGFFNKHAADYFPDFIQRLRVPLKKNNSIMQMVSADKIDDLVYFAEQNTIELHITLSKIAAINKPDQIIFDFDPSDNGFEKVRSAALILKEILDSFGLSSFVKTTGSRGVHVHIPIKVCLEFEEVKVIAKKIAEKLHDNCSEITTLEQRKEKRGDKVFIDYLRNDYAMTTIAPYSLRAHRGAPVATPINWKELEGKTLGACSFNLNNIFHRLAQKQDPWQNFFQINQSIQSIKI